MGSSPSRTLNLKEVSPSARAIKDSRVSDGLTSPAYLDFLSIGVMTERTRKTRARLISLTNASI